LIARKFFRPARELVILFGTRCNRLQRQYAANDDSAGLTSWGGEVLEEKQQTVREALRAYLAAGHCHCEF
jgi:hypothetical protein